MNYTFIEDQELSKVDFAAILQFDREADAIAAAKAINESTETNSPGAVSEGSTGAFRVGKCVVFNACSEACYEKFIKLIGSLESPAEPGDPAVDSLAKALWDGMYDTDRTIEDDTKAAIDYIRAMFPEAEDFREDADCYYFEYDGGKYFIKPEYSIDAKDRVLYGKIVVRDYDSKMEPVTIDRDTDDVKGTLEKIFKKAKSAGDSKKSSGDSKNSAGNSPDSLAAKLWESMADTGSDESTDTDAAIAYLEAVLPRADIRKTESGFIHIEYNGMEYIVTPYYFHGGAGGGYLQFYNKQSGIADLEIDRDTENPGEQVRKLFESPDKPSLMDRLDKLDAEIKKLDNEIWKIKISIKKIKKPIRK